MNNLFDILSSAQNGQGLAGLGQKLGLNEQQMTDLARQVLPAFSSGFKRNVQSEGGAESLAKALETGHHQRYYEETASLNEAQTRKEGEAILGHVFGDKSVSRSVAARAEGNTGISSALIKQALPYLATMIMGGLSRQASSVSSQQMGGGLIGQLVGSFLGGGAQSGSGSQSALLSMLDADGDGSVADDIFDIAKNFIK